jgi:hypothetical protein
MQGGRGRVGRPDGRRTQELPHALALLELLDELRVAAGVLHIHVQLQQVAHLHARPPSSGWCAGVHVGPPMREQAGNRTPVSLL